MKNFSEEKITITGVGSISALGTNSDEIKTSYEKKSHFLTNISSGNDFFSIGKISEAGQTIIQNIRSENNKYKPLDKSVLYAIYAARQAVSRAKWKKNTSFGVNIGSSRGATEVFEQFHSDFLKNHTTSPLTSPTTTLGNIASWVAQDVQSEEIAISHSITCSTSLHAVANAIAWLRAGMADAFLVGGSEAPLTDFTLAQMKSLKIYGNPNEDFPSRPLDFDKKQNTMVLGEGAAVFCLEKGLSDRSLAIISGIGYATEPLTHNVSISENGAVLQKTMQMALKNVDFSEIDIIIPHATGTIKGDLAEMNAISAIFGEKIPILTSNKWKIGHTFGASGAFSMEMALLMLQNDKIYLPPYLKSSKKKKKIKHILINATGFGGNAVSLLLSKP